MAAGPMELRVKVTPELSDEMQALLGTATEDTLEKLSAGAQLVYALYHHPKAKELFGSDLMTRGLVEAYGRACAAYGVGRNHGASG